MRVLALLITALSATSAMAGSLTLEPSVITERKAVYGRVEARDMVPARARIGGIVVELNVSEGDLVKAGQKIATVRDDKLAFQIAAVDAQLKAFRSQLDTAQSELDRANVLVGKGVMTPQRLDQLKTAVDVVRNQIVATEAQRSVIAQMQTEGDVLAPADGRVLTVPVTRGAVIMGGEMVANIGGGGFFLRLAIPERHAAALKENAEIAINANGDNLSGKLVKIYPLIQNGRVVADVEVNGLNTAYVDARVLVEVPVGERKALIVPSAAVTTRSGIDFVTVIEDGKPVERAVVLGETLERDGNPHVEILSGLAAGDTVMTP
ncbi:efflux RND transporter periplasmic adaptor subunit [Rhizobium alvei]|uniref:Efflux RND transporter periplasmic adaptor subunit n=1 Tax=Rhizobium alvei TaxID=1132659 RepID=A0ABT8YK12_9HYPH|nr:efflux RND transporter periplasmic adaptor subunit [Rhizobium alvei]MDO6963861.1 efflux RND transporter periplasmic adaptor subunit [Rhizobium alvei]